MGWTVGGWWGRAQLRGGEGRCCVTSHNTQVEGEAERREGEWGEGRLAGLRREGEECWCALSLLSFLMLCLVLLYILPFIEGVAS
jgi:hypothetical protein